MASNDLSVTRVSTGYLTVVPARVRRATGTRAGDRLEWRIRGTEIVIRVRRKHAIEEITGMFGHGGDAVESKKAAQGLRPRVR